MSATKDKLSIIDAKILALDEKQTELSLEESGLRESRSLLIKDIIEEENLLDSTTWELFVTNSSSSMYLQYAKGTKGNEEKISELRKLCFHSWHDSFELQDGITLHFDDGIYTLHAADPGQLKSFAMNHNFFITAKDIGNQVKRLSRQLNVLQEVCHQFNLQT
jgi:hypothetical protein